MKVTIEFETDMFGKATALERALQGLVSTHNGSRRKIIPDETVVYIDGVRQTWWDERETEVVSRIQKREEEWRNRRALAEA
jgi:hypothetical protein